MIKIIFFLYPLSILALEGCIQPESEICYRCQKGFYLNSLNSCVKCANNCELCNSQKCLRCKYKSILYLNQCYECHQEGCLLCSQNNKCQICHQGYYKKGDFCFKCQKNCLECHKNICSVCKQGFILDFDKRCVKRIQRPKNNNSSTDNNPNIIYITNIKFYMKLILSTLIGGLLIYGLLVLTSKIIEGKRKAFKKNHTNNLLIFSQKNTHNLSFFALRKNLIETENQMVSDNEKKIKNDICSICLCKEPQIQTSCAHSFHVECFIIWCHKKYICPVCFDKSFIIKAKCYQCNQFSKQVNICPKECKSKDHLVCYENRNRNQMVCSMCQ